MTGVQYYELHDGDGVKVGRMPASGRLTLVLIADDGTKSKHTIHGSTGRANVTCAGRDRDGRPLREFRPSSPG